MDRRPASSACDDDRVFTPSRIVVDGETFVVTEESGCVWFTWVSGLNPGYGFGGTRSDRGPLTEDQARAEIRLFLAGIDPESGYLDDPVPAPRI